MTNSLTHQGLGNYINGQFCIPKKPDAEWEVYCPGDKSQLVLKISTEQSHVDQAVESARKAFVPWSVLSNQERGSYLQRLKELYMSNKQLMAETISEETGKPLWETLTEAQTMIDKIDITLNESLKLVSTVRFEKAMPHTDGVIRFKPRGVMTVIGPFNFPGHLPNGHIIPALATGNTVIFKPSEMTPKIGQLMAMMFQKAEFPPGVFNLVQGQGEIGRKLVMHEGIEGVLFTGSYETGLKIKQDTLNHFWKILALEMGGKNAAIVWDDADLDKAVYECLTGAFLSTGQRCSGTSRLILHSKIADQFQTRFYEAAKRLSIGYWKDNPFMGPLVSAASQENYIRFQGIGTREGAECIMRGKALDTGRVGNYVTPSIYKVKQFNPESIYQKTEIFGPNVAIYEVDDFDEAIAVNNGVSYGLVASVFTKDETLYERACQRARVGHVNWNRSTVGASSKLPFGGMGKSGNDRASAHFAVYYCTVPVASLEDSGPFDATKILPGMNYKV